jgi:hypothetical protein
VQNDGNTPDNKPDIIIRDNKKGKCSMLLDVAISGDRNVVKKEAEKILIYTHLTTEIQPMWIVKTKVRPVIKGVAKTISESFKIYPSSIRESRT